MNTDLKKLVILMLGILMLTMPMVTLASDSADTGVITNFTQEEQTIDHIVAIGSVIFVLIVGLFSALRERNHNLLLKSFKEALERKDLRSTAETMYLQSSIKIQDAVQLFQIALQAASKANLPVVDGYLDVASEFVTEVTADRQPDNLQQPTKETK